MDEMYILFYKDKQKTLNNLKQKGEAFYIAIHSNNSLIVYSSSQYIILQNTTTLLYQQFKINQNPIKQFILCLKIEFSNFFPYILTVHRNLTNKYFTIWKMHSLNNLKQYAQYQSNFRDNQECSPFFFKTKQIGLIEIKGIIEIIMLRTKKIIIKIKLYQDQRYNFRKNHILFSLHQYYLEKFDLRTRKNKRTLFNDDINELACSVSKNADYLLFKNFNDQLIMRQIDNINIPFRVLPINPNFYATIHYNQYLYQVLVCYVKQKKKGDQEKWILIYDLLNKRRSEQRFGKFENYAVSENFKFVVTSSIKDPVRIYIWRR